MEFLAGNRIRGTSAEKAGIAGVDTITKDNQAIIQNGTTGGAVTSGTFSSFVVGNNTNRALIVASGSYNASPSIVSVKFNGTESFTLIQDFMGTNFRVELWILYNPTATTADVVIDYGTGAGQMGAIVYSFYGVKQSSATGTPVTKNGSASATPFIPITPTETGSMIIDSWYSGSDASVPNNDFADGMNIICGGIDRSMASQYNLTPTIGSVNNMSRVAGSASYSQTAVEVKANSVLPNVEDGAIFYDTDVNKSYVLNSGTWTEV